MLDPEIEGYYLRTRESARLDQQEGELERVRTQSILARFLPSAPAVVFDVGGASGVHAFWLAERGYQVHLVDPVEKHLDEARAIEAESEVRLASISPGDARKLDAPDQSADAVLLFGPLYHLPDRAQRRLALSEARRILKPAGVLLSAGVSRFASLLDGLRTGAFHDPAFREIIAADLGSGEHRNPSGDPAWFTTAYFHRPEELAGEAAEFFADVRVIAIEGPLWMAAKFRAAWADRAERERLLEFLEQIESEPSIAGASAHFIASGRAA